MIVFNYDCYFLVRIFFLAFIIMPIIFYIRYHRSPYVLRPFPKNSYDFIEMIYAFIVMVFTFLLIFNPPPLAERWSFGFIFFTMGLLLQIWATITEASFSFLAGFL